LLLLILLLLIIYYYCYRYYQYHLTHTLSMGQAKQIGLTCQSDWRAQVMHPSAILPSSAPILSKSNSCCHHSSSPLFFRSADRGQGWAGVCECVWVHTLSPSVHKDTSVLAETCRPVEFTVITVYMCWLPWDLILYWGMAKLKAQHKTRQTVHTLVVKVMEPPKLMLSGMLCAKQCIHASNQIGMAQLGKLDDREGWPEKWASAFAQQ